jgi:hypothetical protein
VWSVDNWQSADFSQPTPKCPQPADPWLMLPVQGPRRPVPGRTREESDLGIWIDELRAPEARAPSVRIPVPAALESLLRSLDFDPQARRTAWRRQPWTSDGERSAARRKAAGLVALLEISRACDREEALSLLTELFEAFPHAASHQALLGQVRTGADLDTLLTMGELKRLWLATPAWWSHRRYCPLRRQLEFVRDRQGAQKLSWRLARRICEVRWRWPVEAMIADAWLDEWRTLPFAVHASWTFAQFLDWRLDRDPEDDCYLSIPEESSHGLRPSPLAWQEIAASSVPLADLVPTRSVPQPGQLQ